MPAPFSMSAKVVVEAQKNVLIWEIETFLDLIAIHVIVIMLGMFIV